MGFEHWLMSRLESAVSYLAAGMKYRSFHELCASISEHIRGHEAVLDREIVCLDKYGRLQFKELMFRRGEPFFYAFDLLWLNGEDLRSLKLISRKARLRKLIAVGSLGCCISIIWSATAPACTRRRVSSILKESSRSGKMAAI